MIMEKSIQEERLEQNSQAMAAIMTERKVLPILL